MTTFVDTSLLLTGQQAEDQDPVIVVVRSAQGMLREGLGEADSGEFERKFSHEYSCKNWKSIFDLLLGNAPVVFKKLSTTEDSQTAERICKTAEGYFEVALSVLSKLETVEDVVDRINSFVAIMSSASSGNLSVQALKLKLLTTLFNTLSPKAELRLTVVKGLCKFSQSNNHQSQVFALVKNCDLWMQENDWELTDAQKSEIYALIREVASPEDRVKFLKLQIAVSTEKSDDDLIQQAILESIKAESVLRFDDLVSLAEEQQLEEGAVKKLLEIFVAGNDKFDEMERFLSCGPGKNLGLEKDKVIAKMRVIALISLASESQGEITLSQIGQKLKTDDPISVIVRALRAGLIKGSIDEVRGIFSVRAVAGNRAWGKDISDMISRIG